MTKYRWFFISLGLFVYSHEVQSKPLSPADATFIQSLEPQLQARQAKAQQREKAGKQFFANKQDFQSAFLELASLPLYDVATVHVRLHELQKRAEEREKQRLMAPKIQFSPKILQRWKEQQNRALQAEERADAIERRLLSALSLWLQQAPDLALIGKKKQQWAEMRANFSFDKPAEKPKIEESVRQQSRLDLLWRTVIRKSRGERELDAFIQEELQFVPAQLSAMQQAGQLERFSLILPLLESNTRLAVEKRQEVLRQLQLQKKLEMWQQKWEEEKANTEKDIDELVVNKSKIEADIQLIEKNIGSKIGVEKEIAAIKLRINKHRLEKLSNHVRNSLEKEEKIKKQLSESRKKLDEAVRQSKRENEQKKKRVLEKIVALRKLSEDINSSESERVKENNTYYQLQNEKLQQLSVGIKAALAMPPMDANRQQAIDKVFVDSHQLVLDIRAKITSHQQLIHSYKKKKSEQETPTVQQISEKKLLEEQNQAIADLFTAYQTTINHLVEEVDDLVSILVLAKKKRREVQPLVTAQAKDVEKLDFWNQLQDEILMIPIKISTWAHNATKWLKNFPNNIIAVKQLSGIFWFLINTTFLAFVWRFLRRYAHVLFIRLFQLTRKRFFLLSLPSKMVRLQSDVLQQISAHLIDACILLLIFNYFMISFPFVAFLFYLTAFYYVLQLAPKLISLMIDASENIFENVLHEDFDRQLLYSFQALVWWWMGFSALRFFIVQLWDADRLDNIAAVVQFVVLIFLLLQLLKDWEKTIVDTVKSQYSEGVLLRWMNSTAGGHLAGRLRSGIGILILLQNAISWCISLLIEGSSWLGTTLARRSLQDQEISKQELPAELLEKYLATSQEEILYDDEERLLERIFNEWLVDQNRGLVALVGDHGSGKSRITSRLNVVLGQQLAHRKLVVTQRLLNEEQALAWLINSFELPENSSLSSVIEAIYQLDSLLITIDDLHLSMLRDVRGYAALRLIIGVMQATGDKHFWVTAFHTFTWNFLEGAAAPVNLDVFREKVHIKPLTITEISRWFIERAEKAQVVFNFSFLVQKGANKKRIDRAEKAYWRLLADESGGNHSVAQEYFSTSLFQGEEEQVINIFLFQIPDEQCIEELTDTELFVLMALLIHDGLPLDLLQRTLNMRKDEVQSSCRQLIGLDIIKCIDGVYGVTMAWRPQVERYLHQRRMLCSE